jgi:DNA-binding MarR family transcriptional regulator
MSRDDSSQSAHSPLSLVFRAAQQLRTTLDRELEPVGITGQQAALVLLCSRGASASFDSLAQNLGTDGAGVTRLADRLEAKGLIARRASPTDRRATQLVLTPTGHDLVPELRRLFARWRARALSGLPPANLSHFAQSLCRILDNTKTGADRDNQPTLVTDFVRRSRSLERRRPYG